MQEEINKLITELQARDASDAIHKGEMEAIKAEIKNVREDMARKSVSTAGSASSDEAEAIATFMVKGNRRALELGFKADNYAILSGSADGGIAVPTIIGNDVVAKLAMESPLLGRSTVSRNSGFQKILLQKTKGTAATRVERGAMALQASDEFAGITLGRVQVFAHQAHTDEAVNGDSVINFQQVLMNSATLSMAEQISYQLVSGVVTNAVENVSGTTTIPMGVLGRVTEAYVDRFSGSIGKTPVITSGTEDGFGFDDVQKLAYSLHAKFDNRAAYLMNPDILLELAQKKDSDGRYLLQQDVTAAHGYVLFGKPVLLDDFMPTKAEALAAGSPFILLADWSQNVVNFHGNGSWVVDPYTTAGLVKYRYQEAFGSVFKDSQAIRGLKMLNAV